MGRNDPAAAPPAFWRCPRCNTPNPAAAYLTRCVGCGRPRMKVEPEVLKDEAAAAARMQKPRRPWASWAATATCAVAVLAALAVIRLAPETSWYGAVAAFLPRWAFLAPVAVLGAFAAWRRRLGVGLATAAIGAIVAGPLMGFNVPGDVHGAADGGGVRIRVLTLNRGSEPLDVAKLRALLDREKIDVVFLQERADDPGTERLFAEGWERNPRGSVASRHPIVEVLPPLPEESRDQGRYMGELWRVVIRGPGGVEFLAASVHLPTLRPGFARLRRGDTGGLELLVPWWNGRLATIMDLLDMRDGRPLVAGGDFNMPADHPGMAPLRAAYRLGFEDAGLGYGYTRPTSTPWARIDQVVASRDCGFAWCRVGPDVGSDHLPVLAEVVLPAAAGPASTRAR